MEEFLKIPFQYKTFFFYQKMVPSVAFVLCNLHPCIQCSGAGKANILVPILMLRRNTEFVFELNQHKEDFFKLGLSSFFSFCSFKSPCFFFCYFVFMALKILWVAYQLHKGTIRKFSNVNNNKGSKFSDI
jgi:hypothetical protein